MRKFLWLSAVFILLACQPAAAKSVTVLDGSQIYTLAPASLIPAEIFAQARVNLGPNDRVLFNGMRVPLDQALPAAGSVTLQVRRAVTLTLVTPDGQRAIQTAAWTIGEALRETGISLYASDKLDPPAETPITGPVTVNYAPSRELTVSLGVQSRQIRSSAGTVGTALAEAGIPLIGLDTSLPSENEALPTDGQIRVIHVSESVVLSQKPIPFTSEFIASADVPLDQQQVLNPGQTGLTVSRVRIRYEDGKEISRVTESESQVRPPQNRIVGYGTKVEIKTATVDGVQIQYWRAVQMYATAYSPCRSAPDQCYPRTASGKPVTKGVVAVVYNWYLNMRGQALYIPGYGHASIEDVGGGIPGRYWIDLGYSDSDYQGWGAWVTVYFLTPVPPNIIYVLE
jgi:uncharacterized protein YabE (DUF348 family)